MTGTIVTIKYDKNYGFISSPDERDNIFFFMDQLRGLAWSPTLEQRRGAFETRPAQRGGLRAINIHAAD